MKFMNEYELDECLELFRREGSFASDYAQALSDWRDTVNENSDGWAYWTPAIVAAEDLITILEQERTRLLFQGLAGVSENHKISEPKKLDSALKKIQDFAAEKSLPIPTIKKEKF